MICCMAGWNVHLKLLLSLQLLPYSVSYTGFTMVSLNIYFRHIGGEAVGSAVAQCLTRDRGVACSSLTSVTALLCV